MLLISTYSVIHVQYLNFINTHFRQIIKGYKQPVLFDDLYDMMDRDKCAPIVDTVEREWHKQTEGLDYQRYIAVTSLL